MLAALPPRPPGNPPKELPPAGQRRLPDGRRPDHMWNVLQGREESPAPRRAVSREEQRRESRSLPSRPELEELPYPGQLPPLGWPAAPMNDWDLKANLRPRLLLDSGAEAKEFLERRLEGALTEQRTELARRFQSFEQGEKHFKDWVQREHEQLHSQLQQLRVSVSETGQQQQRLVGNLSTQNQKQDLRLQDLEGQMAQAAAQVQSLMSAVSAGALSGGGTGEATGAAAVAASASANLEVLRAGLEREANARVALGAETAEQLKQLSEMVFEVSNRQQQQQVSAQQQFQQNAAQEEKELIRYESKLSALEPSLSQLREDMEELRRMLYRCGTDCAKRCEESEEFCQKRLGGVHEAAINAARELWEEHQGVVVECKSSLAALQQILESKDKIALQLRSLQQQQREEDKQELWTQFQVRHEQFQARLVDQERGLLAEQSTRIEEQQRAEGVISRLGLALEKAQAVWLRDSAKLSEEIHEAKRDWSIEMDGETRGVARRLALGLEEQRRQMDDLDRKIVAAKVELGGFGERLEACARAQQQELRDSEARGQRQMNDVQTMQMGRTQQAVFDIKAELAKLEQATQQRVGSLQKGQDELEARTMNALGSLELRTLQKIQDVSEVEREKSRSELCRALDDERLERVRASEELRSEHAQQLEQLREAGTEARRALEEDVQRGEERLLRRLEEQVAVERDKTREQIQQVMEEERSERLRAESEQLQAVQKRLLAHEELTVQRFSEHTTRMEVEFETMRQRIEAQHLREKQELQKELADFTQEQRAQSQAMASELSAVAEAAERHRAATEQRLAQEAAALAAQLGVATAGLTAQLGQLGRQVDGQQQALEAQGVQLKGEIEKVSDELDKMNGELLKLIDDESQKVKEGQEAMSSRVATLEMAFMARTAALGERDAQLEAMLEDQVKAHGEAVRELRETTASEAAALRESLSEDLRAVELESARRCEQMASELSSSEARAQAEMAKAREQLEELRKGQEEETRRASAAEEGLQREGDEHAKQLAQQAEKQLALLEKASDDMARRFAELQAQREAEKAGETASRAEEQRATEALLGDMSQKAEASQAHMQEMLKELAKANEAKVQEEKNRAMESETALREGLAAQASQAAAQAAAQAQAQAAQAEDTKRQTREAEELRKQIAEQGDKLESVKSSCLEATEKVKEEAAKAVESVRDDALGAVATESREAMAKLESQLTEANAEQTQLKEKLQQLQKSDEDFQQALSGEEQRARRAEEAIEAQLAEASKSSAALNEKVEEAQKRAEKASAEAAVAQDSVAQAQAKSEASSKAADQSLETELGKLKKESEEESRAHLERIGALEQQILKLEQSEKEASEHRGLQAKQQEDQSKAAQEVQQRQEAAVEELKKKLLGLETSSKTEEMLESCQAELTVLSEKLDQELGTVRLRMEGGFRALLERLEAERWVKENVDMVADGVSNSFLRLLDKSSEKLKERVEKLEKPEAE